MIETAVIGFVALLIILFSSELFVNGIENLGGSLSLSQAFVGSILAAVGTALPETIIPLIAIFGLKSGHNVEIGIGSILGAPFMLATLGFFIVGLGVFLSKNFSKKRISYVPVFEIATLRRDLIYFITSFAFGVIIPAVFQITNRWILWGIGAFLIIKYIYYVMHTFKSESGMVEPHQNLYITSFFNIQNKKILSLLSFIQCVIALVIMIKSAHVFVKSIEKIALALNFSPLIFSLLIAPVATELPEKFNSLLWSLKGKDTLAIGNIVGAMVFQSTFPVSIGLFFTPWQFSFLAFVSVIITFVLSIIYLIFLVTFKKFPPQLFFLSLLGYVLYIVIIFIKI